MTHTVVSSATREVILGFDRPFVLIGERINPTGRKLLAEEMRNGDFSRVERGALALGGRAADHGIPRSDIVVDPLVMPIGAMRTAGQQVFRLVRRLHEELGVNTTCGASNVSFGLANRGGVNAAFLPMAIASRLASPA